MQLAARNGQRTIRNMPHATYNLQHATCNRKHTTSSVQRELAACSVQHATYDIQCATCNMRHCNNQQPTCNKPSPTYFWLLSLFSAILITRKLLQTKKCIDFSPAINIALSCKHTKAAQMLLSHGAMYEIMYEVRWNKLGIHTLTTHLIKGIRCRGPLGYCEWSSITLVDLRRNNLETIPSMLFHLPLLGTLLLDNNKIKELPNAKWITESLNHLYLSHNRLSDLPMVLGSSNLRTLYLDNNSFTSIPKCVCRIAGLETLDISQNQLEWIPLDIGLLSKLSCFVFDHHKVIIVIIFRHDGSGKRVLSVTPS